MSSFRRVRSLLKEIAYNLEQGLEIAMDKVCWVIDLIGNARPR
jgi:hypothetical protein